MKFKIIAFILSIISISQGFAQVKNKKPIKMKYVPTDMILCIPEPKDSLKPFYISNHLTTNKEYFTFLLWVYYVDRYSSKRNLILEYLPKDEVNFIRLFHSEYDNLPVLGLTNKQIIEYCTWKTSRLNEYILNKYVIKNKKQIKRQFIWTSSHSLYTLEAFVFQMEHIIDRKFYEKWEIKDTITDENDFRNKIIWNSNYLYPNFRLPTEEELFFANYPNGNFAISNGLPDKSIEYFYEQLKEYWYKDDYAFDLSRQIDYFFDLKIGTKSKPSQKLLYNYEHSYKINKKSRFVNRLELVFYDSTSNNFDCYKNEALFNKIKRDKIERCLELDSLGKINTKCNILIIDEENSKPVFIKYDEYIKYYNNIKYSILGTGNYNDDSSYSNYAGFRCVMFAPGY
ncbi:MAG: SUMF1/EgtB/PvdO family nonheme iron enzyme [Bacteroidia bacterium]